MTELVPTTMHTPEQLSTKCTKQLEIHFFMLKVGHNGCIYPDLGFDPLESVRGGGSVGVNCELRKASILPR